MSSPKLCRIAFLTPEFPTEIPDGGGVGNYVLKMAKALKELGHIPEVFVSSSEEAGVLTHGGIRVERVSHASGRRWPRFLSRLVVISRMPGHWREPASFYSRAVSFADALERRHRETAFDVVQSADYLACGLTVRRVHGRVHLVRCSNAADLYNEVDGCHSGFDRWRERLECKVMRRADRVYAPSEFIAAHHRARLGIPVQVVRPPAGLEVAPVGEGLEGIPVRYFLHFGNLIKRKGTPWLIAALKLAFELEPSLRMVIVGRGSFNEIGSLLAGLGQNRSKVVVLYPLPKPQLYALIRRAQAVVHPALVDNFPNAVIETLLLGTPVIGTKGASIDELVQDGVNGLLVAAGDTAALAQALATAWRGPWRTGDRVTLGGDIAQAMVPATAIQSFLRLAAP